MGYHTWTRWPTLRKELYKILIMISKVHAACGNDITLEPGTISKKEVRMSWMLFGLLSLCLIE